MLQNVTLHEQLIDTLRRPACQFNLGISRARLIGTTQPTNTTYLEHEPLAEPQNALSMAVALEIPPTSRCLATLFPSPQELRCH